MDIVHKQHLLSLLNEGRVIAAIWDCGADESLMKIFLDNQYIYDDFAFALDDLITDKLFLPDAGDFSLKGKGRIFIEENNVVINYSYAYYDTYIGEDGVDYGGDNEVYEPTEQGEKQAVLLEL